MTRHLLPCHCSRRIEVAAAQAGGSIRCPDCGAELTVPRLGELTRFEAVSAGASPSRHGWGPVQACLLAGVLVAVVAVTTAQWLRGRRAGIAPLDEAAIVTSVATSPVERVHEAWLNYERQGIARPPQADEQRRRSQAESLAVLERIAWATAAAGACLALAAALVVAGRRR